MIGKSVFDVSPNDPNKARKEIAVEFLTLIGMATQRMGWLSLILTAKPTIPTRAGA